MKVKGNRPCKASGDHHRGKAEGPAGLRDRTLCEACFYSSGLSRTVLFVRCQHCDHDSTLGVCVWGGYHPKACNGPGTRSWEHVQGYQIFKLVAIGRGAH